MSCSRFPDCTGARTELGEVISNEPAKPIGNASRDRRTYLCIERPLRARIVQLGEIPKGKGKSKAAKPRRAIMPKGKDPTTVTVEEATQISLAPARLGHTSRNRRAHHCAKSAASGRYIVHNTNEADFRSLKKDDVYTIELPRALEILKEEKKKRGFPRKKK